MVVEQYLHGKLSPASEAQAAEMQKRRIGYGARFVEQKSAKEKAKEAKEKAAKEKAAQAKAVAAAKKEQMAKEAAKAKVKGKNAKNAKKVKGNAAVAKPRKEPIRIESKQ